MAGPRTHASVRPVAGGRASPLSTRAVSPQRGRRACDRITLGAIISVSSSLGYLLPAIIGLESLGVPSPGETALVLAAVLASQGKLQIWLVILIGVASAIVGDNIGYLLGRRFGREVLEHPGPLSPPPAGGDRRRRPLLRQARAQGGVPRPLDRARALRRRLAGGHQRDAVPAVLLLQRARRRHVGRHVRPGGLLRRLGRCRCDHASSASTRPWRLAVLAVGGYVFYKSRERRLARATQPNPPARREGSDSSGGGARRPGGATRRPSRARARRS